MEVGMRRDSERRQAFSEEVRRPGQSEGPRFYSVSQVARLLGMSPMTLYRGIADGQFPAVRIRGRLIIPARVIEAMADVAVHENVVVDSSSWVSEVVSR